MRPGIIRECADIVDLAHRDILDNGRRKKIQRNEFVVRIGRSDRQPVECSRAIAIAEPSDNQLPGIRDGNSRQLFDAFFHIADSFQTHFPSPDRFHEESGFLPFQLQDPFRFAVLLPGHQNLVQYFLVGLQRDVQPNLTLEIDFNFLRDIRDIGDFQRVFSVRDILENKVTVDVRNGRIGCVENDDRRAD